MPPMTASQSTLESLKDVTRLVQKAEGFHPLVAALKNGHGATVDGAWGSSSALVAAALGLHAPRTLLVVIPFPRDVDGWTEDLASFAGTRPVIFPAWDNLPTEETLVDEVAGQRLRVLRHLEASEPPRYVLTTIQALTQPVPDRARLVQQRRRLRVKEQIDPDVLAGWLVEHGFKRTEVVELPGEFSRRGSVLDVYSPDADAPYRLDFFGDEIDEIRQFSPLTQRSSGEPMQGIEVTSAALEPPRTAGNGDRQAQPVLPTGHLCDYLPANAWTALIEPDDLAEQGKHYLERVTDPRGLFSVPGVFQQLLRFPNVRISAMPSPSVEASCHLRVESVERFSGDVTKLRDELDSTTAGDRVVIACHNEAESKRLGEVLAAGQLAQSDRLRLVTGRVRAGFRMVDAGVVVLSDHELFHREDVRQVLPRRRLESRAIDSFLDLAEGDLVVHVAHGIARYRGMQVLEKSGHFEEHLILEFREGTRVYVPASKIDLVQKYVGGAKTEPELSKLGGTAWQHKKARVESAVLDMASDMIELQAMRESKPGLALPPDSDWQTEFEAAFPYEETPDQLTTLGEIKQDMQRSRPMDRLICGDVGYGKTELAIRAAFKTIDSGRQVAVLVPTTVLAEQHYRTFSQRLAEFPFVVEGISRFRTHGEQKRILERLSQGGIDIIIGTHRLISADVQFKELGLVVIDEEQRFGVEHKERLKRLRQTVDVLTLTATPIPRTLHLALLGIRDISNLETPPADRLAIETRIVRFDKELIRHAILRELNRDGQIYFVHNRVYNIKEIASKLQSIVPEARIVVGHGQMPEHELEQAMVKFVRREADILVATTIIESGLDIPNANTMFINQADNYGLADLHQLRGRVGRYKHRAYAYMLLDADRGITPTAARRLKAIEEFTELGAGFKIAMRDLEIRGAGNILGTQQSGHIAAVGYELYCQLLENAVRHLKNQPSRAPLEVNIDLPWRAFLPHDYVAGQRSRIEVYRRLARIRRLDRLDDFRQELRERFGPWPEPAEWLLRMAELRLLAARWHIATVHLEEVLDKSVGPLDVVLGYRNPRRIKRLAEQSRGRLRVVDQNSAYFRLAPQETEPEVLYARLKDLLRLPVPSL
ncbi:MAG TPA: transcription-repair coupling factor [Gemmataceae bacterium]|nr:transcription-repair coupling factor [Gemmataceae bacterium]